MKKYNFHESWRELLTCEIVKTELKELISYLEVKERKERLTPNLDKALRFLKSDLNDIKVLNIGQDPYPQSGVATGRGFEVNITSLENDNDSWNNKHINNSLKNLLKILYYYQTGEQNVTIAKVRKKINSNKFNIRKPSELFSWMEGYGVYFINQAFTTEINESGCHRVIWRTFFDLLLYYITKMNKNILYILWGAPELVKKLDILGVNSDKIISVPHPSKREFKINNYRNIFENDNFNKQYNCNEC